MVVVTADYQTVINDDKDDRKNICTQIFIQTIRVQTQLYMVSLFGLVNGTRYSKTLQSKEFINR